MSNNSPSNDIAPRFSLIRVCRGEAPPPVPVPEQGVEVLEARDFGDTGFVFDLGRVLASVERGNIVRAMNGALSQASGRWVVFLFNDHSPAPGWWESLESALDGSDTDACVHMFLPEDISCLALFAIRRCAFLYGALDEKFPSSRLALHHWAEVVFPASGRRHAPCEGRVAHAASWLGGTAEVDAPAMALFTLWAGLSHGERAVLLQKVLDAKEDCSRELAVLLASEQRAARQSRDDPYGATKAYAPKNFWEVNTAGYVKWEVFQPDEPEIGELVAATSPGSVLELGCGVGRNARYFSASKKYVGLDLSMNLLEKAASRQPANGKGVVCGDVTALCFREGSFDLVFADSTIQHVVPERIGRAVEDMVRISSRWVSVIEFTDEIAEYGRWFEQPHIFRHDYERLFGKWCRLVLKREVGFSVQPAVKMFYLFEKNAG